MTPIDNIAIFSQDCSFFAVPYLAEAIGCELYVNNTQHNNFFGGGTMAKKWDGEAIDCDHLIVVSCEGLRVIASVIEGHHYKTVSIIISDSFACKEQEWCVNFITRNGLYVYAMPDMALFYPPPAIPVYQTMKISYPIKEKPKNRLVISHSPSCEYKALDKGSPHIISVIEDFSLRYDFSFCLIKNRSMAQCIKIKSMSHIFIDQLVYGNPNVNQARWGNNIRYNGGLGKSGIEGMLLGACVITGGEEPDTKGFFPPPPVVWTSYDSFEMDMEKLIEDSVYRDKKTQEQAIWANKYLSAKFVANHITQHIK